MVETTTSLSIEGLTDRFAEAHHEPVGVYILCVCVDEGWGRCVPVDHTSTWISQSPR